MFCLLKMNMLDYYTCKLAVCTVESTVFKLRKTGLQKEPGFGNPKYDHTMDRSVTSAEVVNALRSFTPWSIRSLVTLNL